MKHKTSLIGCIGIASVTLALGTGDALTFGEAEAESELFGIVCPDNGRQSPAKQVNRPIPFHGMVSAVDQTAKTFTTTGKDKSHVFKVTDKTTITKGAQSATIKDISENQEVSGSYWKNSDGTFEAKIVKLGPTEKAKASTSVSPTASPKASPSPKP